MAKGSVVERLYREIKQELTNRSLLPGQRIDVADLCNRYCISPTPLRNVLNRLVGERIIETHSHDGFYIPRISEQGLRDLLTWNEFLLTSAIQDAKPKALAQPLPEPGDDIVVETEAIFTEIGNLSGNSEISLALRSAHDRLRALRRLPDSGFIDIAWELEGIRAAWREQDYDLLQQHIRRYHAKRREALPQLLGLVYTAPIAHH